MVTQRLPECQAAGGMNELELPTGGKSLLPESQEVSQTLQDSAQGWAHVQ